MGTLCKGESWASKTIQLFYKQLIIVKRSVADGDITSNDIFVYNLVIGSWTRGTDKWPSVADKSNFLTDWNGNLSICNGTPDNITEWGYPGIHSEKYFDLTTIGIFPSKTLVKCVGTSSVILPSSWTVKITSKSSRILSE